MRRRFEPSHQSFHSSRLLTFTCGAESISPGECVGAGAYRARASRVQGGGGGGWPARLTPRRITRIRVSYPKESAGLFCSFAREKSFLKSPCATSSLGWGGKRKRPLAFTEHGALMAASVLNTPRAVEMSGFVVRAFVRLRNLLAIHKGLAEKLAELERKLASHDERKDLFAVEGLDRTRIRFARVTEPRRRRYRNCLRSGRSRRPSCSRATSSDNTRCFAC